MLCYTTCFAGGPPREVICPDLHSVYKWTGLGGLQLEDVIGGNLEDLSPLCDIPSARKDI